MAKKKPIKLNDQQLMLDASRVADIYHQMTIDLFDQVIDRIRERGTASLEDNPYLWQLEKMSEMGLLNNANIKLIARYSGVAEEQLRYVIENEGYKVYKDTKTQLLESMGGGDFITNNLIQTTLANYVNQTTGDIDNLINTTLPKSVRKVYQDIVEEAVAKVVTGLMNPNKAISTTVMKWLKKVSMDSRTKVTNDGELMFTLGRLLKRLHGGSIVKQGRHRLMNWALIHSIIR